MRKKRISSINFKEEFPNCIGEIVLINPNYKLKCAEDRLSLELDELKFYVYDGHDGKLMIVRKNRCDANTVDEIVNLIKLAKDDGWLIRISEEVSFRLYSEQVLDLL